MKKVVLLTGALAAGLAATSLNANASVPVAPNVQETNASDQQVAEMTYDKYHASVDVAIKWLYDLEVEFEAADIDADAKKEILKDIEKRSLELSGYTEDMENAWHNYEVDRDDTAKLTALQTALAAVTAKLTSGEVVFPTETQIKTNLRDRYYHVAKDWKIYKDNVTRGYKLLAAFQDLMDDDYKQIDEIEDVKAAKLAVEQAHEKFRLDNENFHADRWYLDKANNWKAVTEDHTTKACCVDKEADLETLYQTFETKKGDFETLLNKYYTAKETLTSKLATSNQAETAALTADPDTYTKSVDGKAWVKAAQQKVNDAQKAADDFIKTYNAANPAVWSNPASVDQFKGEDGKAPAFKKESEYERRANELITAVDNAIKDLDAAVKEAKANEKAYQDGLTALNDRQKELDDIKTAYADKNKEFTTGKVYEQVIKAEQDKINKATTDLTTAWNTWTDKYLVPVNPKNAVEHVAGVTKDNVIYAQLKQDIADLLTKIKKNETANTKIHEMTEALNGHYTELKNAVAGYEDVNLSQYAADGLCAHGEYLGTTSLDNLLKKFIEDEQKKYDAIQSDAYLANTTEDGPTAKKVALDHELEMTWNAIATDQCAKYLAKVEDKYNTKHAYCEGLDDKCNEVEGEGAPCTCSEDDREANPCGWCDATARGMHDAIETAKSEMDGKIQDWHFATDAKNHVAEVKTYKAGAFTAIENWVEAFKTADKAHKDKLDKTKADTDNAIHKNIHEVIGTMRLDAANFETGDTAAADKWAQALTDESMLPYLDLDDTAYNFADFKAFVDAVEAAETPYTVKAQDLYDNHQWSQLNDLLQSIVGENGLVAKSTYMKAVEANRTAKAALLAKVEDVRSDVAEAKNEAACEDPACKTDIANMFTELEQKLTDAETAVNNAFNAGDATAAKNDVDALAPAFGLVKKQIDDLNAQVRASKTAATDMTRMVEKAFDETNGAKILEAQVEGYENFKVRNADPEAITNTEVKYFDEIETMVQDLMDMIAKDDSHEGGHVAATNTAKYLDEMNKIQKELDKLVQAIKDNEQAHKDQVKHRDELYKKYECYDTTGLEAAVNDIAPDFSLDTEFPEVPGYPETAVDPAGKDHTKAHTAVAEAIKALDAEIKKHYENGASNVEAAKTKIGEKETEYTKAFTHAQTNDSKFMEEYGKCTEAAKAVGNPAPLNWEADHFENGANKYSDEANVQVTNAYNEMVAAQKAYLADIKTDWYKNEAVEKVANNAPLLNTYKEKISAYNAAVEKAQKNDQEFDKQLAAHVVKPLTAESTYTDGRVVADPLYVTLKAQLTALYPECNNVEATSKYNTIRKQIIQDWEDEKSALNGTAAAVAAYQAAAKKYNELMANLNAYGSQLVKYLQQKDAFDAAKTTIAGYDIMVAGKKNIDGADAQDYNHKKDIEKAINTINGKLNTLYGDMKTEATHVAKTINDADLANNEVNDLNVAPAVGTIKTLIENLGKDAKKYEDACDANEAAFEPLHDNIKTVEADYAEGSAKVTALPEPAQEAFNLAVKEDLEALADLQKDLEEAYMDEDAVNFTKDNTDYEDLKKEIEDMYKRAVQAGANLGDIDGINGVTVYDSDALVDIVLYNRGYDVKGDFDFNGENDVTDVERLNNLLWYEHIEKAWAPGRVAFEGDIELTAEGNTVALALNNNVKANGIQFDVTVPEGAYIQNVLGTDRVEGMRVLTACIADNTYRVLVISTLNASTINGNEGAIVTFNVAGGSEVEVSNVIATDGNSHRLNGAALSVGVTTSIDEVAAEGETELFGLDGIRQSVMKAGVNIVRGANGVAKKIFNK